MVIVTWAADLVSDSHKVAPVVTWTQRMGRVKGKTLIPGLGHPIRHPPGRSHPETELVVVLEVGETLREKIGKEEHGQHPWT